MRVKLAAELQIADKVVHAKDVCGKHEIAVVATSFFSAYLNCINNTANDGHIILFSGINTDEQIKNNEGVISAQYLEKLHRDEGVGSYVSPDGITVNFVGTSGYTQKDVSVAIDLLSLHYHTKYHKIQNALVYGLNSSVLHYKHKDYTICSSRVIEKLLSPKNLDDAKYGEIIQSTLKVLIKV